MKSFAKIWRLWDMGSEWDKVALEDVAEIIDSRHKTPKYSAEGFPMIRAVDIKGEAIEYKDTKLVSLEVYKDFSKGRDPQVGDLIISRVGQYLGKVSYVAEEKNFCLGQNIAFIVPAINWRFLYFYLISPDITEQIKNMTVGAAQPTISLKSIRALKLQIPPKKEQKSIAHILGTLDDKIELNRQKNQTLEQMAQALYKSWFVDFDPVIDNALLAGNDIPEELVKRAEARKALGDKRKGLPEDIQRMFPSEFEYSGELGKWVPKGWEAIKLEQIAIVKYGKDHKKLEEGNIPVYGSGGIMRYVNQSLYKSESVLIPRKGTLKNIMYVDEEFWSVDTMFFTIMKENKYAKFIYYTLRLLDFENMNVGSAVPSMTTQVLNIH